MTLSTKKSKFELAGIPRDILWTMVDSLETKEVVNLCKTNKQFNKWLCGTNLFWILRLQKDFKYKYEGNDAKKMYEKFLLEGEGALLAIKKHREMRKDEKEGKKKVEISSEEVEGYLENIKLNARISSEKIEDMRNKFKTKNYMISKGRKTAIIAINEIKSFISHHLGIATNRFALDPNELDRVDFFTKSVNLIFSVPSDGKYIGLDEFWVSFNARGGELVVNYPSVGKASINPDFFYILWFCMDQSKKKGPFYKFMVKYAALK